MCLGTLLKIYPRPHNHFIKQLYMKAHTLFCHVPVRSTLMPPYSQDTQEVASKHIILIRKGMKGVECSAGWDDTLGEVKESERWMPNRSSYYVFSNWCWWLIKACANVLPVTCCSFPNFPPFHPQVRPRGRWAFPFTSPNSHSHPPRLLIHHDRTGKSVHGKQPIILYRIIFLFSIVILVI